MDLDYTSLIPPHIQNSSSTLFIVYVMWRMQPRAGAESDAVARQPAVGEHGAVGGGDSLDQQRTRFMPGRLMADQLFGG